MNRQMDIKNRVYHQTEAINEVFDILPEYSSIHMETIMNHANSTVFKKLFEYNQFSITNENKADFILKFSENDIVRNHFFDLQTVFRNELFSFITHQPTTK